MTDSTCGQPDGDVSGASSSSTWDARLALGFARREARTVLVRRSHRGPLVVQKTLHPEGPDVCHAVVVHPPGGIAGGDRLALTVEVDASAHAQLTTPGATKWYRSTGAVATQTITARVDAGAVLEWLPQPSIVFDGACAESSTKIALAGDAVYIGWEIVCLGRLASGERFERGVYRQRFELARDNALIWVERAHIDAGGSLAMSPVGLNGSPMLGTFTVAAPTISDEALIACRATRLDGGAGVATGVTRLPGVLIARCRGNDAEVARRWFVALWTIVRPLVCARPAIAPRIWNT